MEALREQRWEDRKAIFIPPSHRFSPAGYEVAPVEELVAKKYVEENHYSGRFVAARVRVGLFFHGKLQGVVVYSHPMNDAVLTSVFKGKKARDFTELGRLVIDPSVGFNGGSWFVSRSMHFVRKAGIRGVISFADPLPRQSLLTGEWVMPGHLGIVYRALNAKFTGRGRGEPLLLFRDGTSLVRRAANKVRQLEQGYMSVVRLLEQHGAAPLVLPYPEELELEENRIVARAWLDCWLPVLCREVSHPGNLRYVWPLEDDVQLLKDVIPFPKRQEVARLLPDDATRAVFMRAVA